MPTPDGPEALHQFLGMTNYLHKFISNFSEKTVPLWKLLRNEAKAFNNVKAHILQPLVLKYFDPSKPVMLSVQASKSALGAAYFQDGLSGLCLTSLNRGGNSICAKTEKELLSDTFACRKFHDFIYSQQVIKTNDKPITAIINKPLHLAPICLQHMPLQLQKYDLKFTYKKGTELYVPDMLPRFYIDEKNDPDIDEQVTSCPLYQFLRLI